MEKEATVAVDSVKTFKRGSDVRKVPLANVRFEDGFNARTKENYGDLEELADSLQAEGQFDPAIAYFDKATGTTVLIDGHRRSLAWGIVEKRTGQPQELRVEYRNVGIVDRLVIQYSSNLSRPNTEYERALIVDKMINAGQTKEDIIARLHMSQPTFYGLRKLLSFPEEVQTHIATGSLSGTTARDIFREVGNDPEALVAAADEAVKNAKESGKKKATARHASVGKTRTTAGIMKTTIQKLQGKVEEEKATEREIFALELMNKLVAKVSDRTLMDFIRKG